MKTLILKTLSTFSYVLVKTTEKDIKKVDEHLSSDKVKEAFHETLIAYGDIDSVENYDARKFIPIEKIHKHKDYGTGTTFTEEYKCYCGTSKLEHNVILHEDALSSLKCACSALGTKYFFIIKQPNGENSN